MSNLYKQIRRALLTFAILYGTTFGAYSDLVQNVTSLYCPGTPGPVWMSSEDWVPIVGNSNISVYPIFIAAREWGQGRIMAVGHASVFKDTSSADNAKFTENTFNWMCNGESKKIAYLTGCSFTMPSGSAVYNLLFPKGFSILSISAPITASKLSGISCLVVGNMWNHQFTESEVEVVQQYISNGGGLLLSGLGWSWLSYHPEQTIHDYPMMKLAQPYGIRWLGGYMTPDFNQFYPNLNVFTLSGAMDYLRMTHQSYHNDLPSILQSNSEIRQLYFQSNTVLGAPLNFEDEHQDRAVAYQFYKDLIEDFPTHLKKDVIYDSKAYSAMAQSREQIYYNFSTSLNSSDLKQEIANTIGLVGLYRDIYLEHDLFLLDNSSLNEEQKSFIYRYKNSIPDSLDNLRFISVRDFLGNPWYSLPFQGNVHRVNIFGCNIGQYSENSYPSDSLPEYGDVFSIVVAHEHNHVVDVDSINSNHNLLIRKHELIEQAAPNDIIFNSTSQGGVNWSYTKTSFLSKGYWDGDESSWNSSWNYYWSSGPGKEYNERWLRNNLKLMCEARQEAFATLANQYFTNSEIMLDLSIRRWDRGITTCINQFLFFVDVYSKGTDRSVFYQIDTQGNIRYFFVHVGRNQNNHINKLFFGNKVFYFEIDSNGNVISIDGPIFNDALLADINKDGDIDTLDILLLSEHWLSNEENCPANIFYIGVVDFEDFSIISEYWKYDIP
jgi:hypothetical protein